MKEELIKRLQSQEVIVKFTKKDGSQRTMKCTLKESSIPADKRPNVSKVEDPTDTIHVFDLEKMGWRSININRICSID